MDPARSTVSRRSVLQVLAAVPVLISATAVDTGTASAAATAQPAASSAHTAQHPVRRNYNHIIGVL